MPQTEQDQAQQILAGASGLDDIARADAWEAFHSAQDENDLATRLKGLNVPNPVKAELWEAKHSQQPNLATGAGMEQRAQQQAREAVNRPLTTATLPGERKAGEAPTMFSRFFETTTGAPHPVDQLTGQEVPMLVARPGAYAREAGRQIVEGPARFVSGAMLHPLETSERIMPVNQAIRDARSGRPGAAAGDLAGGILNTVNLAKAAEQLPGAADSIAQAMPETPKSIRVLARVAPRALRTMASRSEQASAETPAASIRAAVPQAAGPEPSQPVMFIPEPRPSFRGENPGYMASVPRETLRDLALAGKPGAARQLQNLGSTILYEPRGANYPSMPRDVTVFTPQGVPIHIGNADVVPFMPRQPESIIEAARKSAAADD